MDGGLLLTRYYSNIPIMILFSHGVWRGRGWWLGGPNRAHCSYRGIENSACDLLIVESRGAIHSGLLSRIGFQTGHPNCTGSLRCETIRMILTPVSFSIFQLTFVHDVTSNSKDTSSGNTITKSSSKVNEPTSSSAAAAGGSTTASNQLVPIKLQNGGTSTATKSKVSPSTTTRCNLLITE